MSGPSLVLEWAVSGVFRHPWLLKVSIYIYPSQLNQAKNNATNTIQLIDMPMEARGLFSGILQQGYALGYLIAAVFNLYVVPGSPYTWKMLFYIGAGLTLAVAFARLLFPESKQFIEQKKNGENAKGQQKVKLFWADGKKIMKEYWGRALYAVVMMGMGASPSREKILRDCAANRFCSQKRSSTLCPTLRRICSRHTCSRPKGFLPRWPPKQQSLQRPALSLVGR